MAGTEEKKAAKKRDPDEAPAIVLLDATITAMEAGVPYEKIIPALRFARRARGYKAPVWRASADDLQAYAAEQNGHASTQEPTGTGMPS